MFRREWCQDVDNWSLSVCVCAISLRFCFLTRALWQRSRVRSAQPGEPTVTWGRVSQQVQARTLYMWSVYIWELSVLYPWALFLILTLPHKLNTLTFLTENRALTTRSKLSDPWKQSWLCLKMNLIVIKTYFLWHQKTRGCCPDTHIDSFCSRSLL